MAPHVASQRTAGLPSGWKYDALTTLVFSALAIEALANAFGEKKINGWADFEMSSPMGKLRVVTGTLGIPFDPGKEPWATARWLVTFRNRIAHARRCADT